MAKVQKDKDRKIVLSDGYGLPTVLGLDCSSSTVGWGLIELSDPLKLLQYGYIKPLDSKHDDIERLHNIFNKIALLCDDLKPTYTAVEDIVLFIRNKSTARTITLLTSFNRIISLSAYIKTHNMNFYSVNNIRKTIKNFLNFSNSIEKDQMPNIIRSYLSMDFKNILNKKGNILKEFYDVSDGIAVAWCFGIRHISKPKKKERKKNVKK